mgnify:CR=1 FL=1
MWLLAQEIPGAGIVTDAMGRTQTEPGLIAVFVLGALFILGMVHYWFVAIPERKAHRENGEKLTTAVAALCPVMAKNSEVTEQTGRHVRSIHKMMQAGISAIEKINAGGTDVSLQYEIGLMKGALGELEQDEHRSPGH